MTSQPLLVCLRTGIFHLAPILVGQSCRFALVEVSAIGQIQNIALLVFWKFGRRGNDALPGIGAPVSEPARFWKRQHRAGPEIGAPIAVSAVTRLPSFWIRLSGLGMRSCHARNQPDIGFVQSLGCDSYPGNARAG